MAKIEFNIKKVIGIVLVGGIVIGGLQMRDTGPTVKDISPDVLKKGQVNLVDVMESPIIDDPNYREPSKFNCITLRDKFLHTPVSKLGKIDPQRIIEANCDEALKKYDKSLIIKKLITCLKETKRTPACAKQLLYFRAFSILNLIKADPEIHESNDNVKLHKIIWDLATTSEYKVNEMEKLITRIDMLLENHPYLYALHKAKLIYVVIKDATYPEKRIDDRMYKTWEVMTELRPDTRDNWELRYMNVLKHKLFFEPKDMKDWANNFLLDYPEYYMSYYYFSYYYWAIEKDKAEAISWLNAGISKTQDPTGKLKQIVKKVQNAAAGEKIFNFEFKFEIIHD
tara:strand:+ start:551 stop:1570 length:1020 start_codon:yes stop_codon:yes gene_type:complete